MQVLKDDKNEIFRAAANAQKICDYVAKLALEAQPFVVKDATTSPKSEGTPFNTADVGDLVHQRAVFRP